MDASEIVRARLNSVPGVTDLVGSRIYPQVAPQEAMAPTIAYDCTINNPVAGTAPVLDASVQVGCWAATNELAHHVARAAKVALQDYSGQAGNTRLLWLDYDSQSEAFDFEFKMWGVVVTLKGVAVVS
jgi:hypothetical protein